ncbi:MAG: hypothetical protein LBQ28_04005 [Prevotellaceae bacterium]|jgi:hypothetical protein|nr:hypothetical protein [Prevotellaceae bacterium]
MRKITLVLVICLFTANLFAQEKQEESNFLTKLFDNGFLMSMEFRTGSNPTFKKAKSFQNSDWITSFGYNFNKTLSAYIPIGMETALFEQDGERDWKESETLGLGLSFKIFKREDGAGFAALNVSAGRAISGDKDWKYTYYDVGFNMSAGIKYLKGMLGFGFRFYDAHKNVKNRNAIYLSLGLFLGS